MNSSGGNNVVTISPSVIVRIECISLTGTTAASWEWVVSANWQGWVGRGRVALEIGPTFSSNVILTSTDAGSTLGPLFDLYRDSASPAAADALGYVTFSGRDSVNAKTTYAQIHTAITDPTTASQDGALIFSSMSAGTLAERMRIDANVHVPLLAPDTVIQSVDSSTGGRITIEKPTSTILNGNVDIFLNSDRIYFQEDVSPNRGAYLDIAGTSSDKILTTADIVSGQVVSKYWVKLAANYTLTSTTAVQKLFNTTTNGALTLGTGMYEFDAVYYLTGMSGTSGNGTARLVGAGTATVDRIMQQAIGLDSTTPTTAAAMGGAVSTTESVQVATAATGTGLVVSLRGTFRVTASGTIIPSIALTTAVAAVVQIGSYFKCAKIGDSSVNSVGSWS